MWGVLQWFCRWRRARLLRPRVSGDHGLSPWGRPAGQSRLHPNSFRHGVLPTKYPTPRVWSERGPDCCHWVPWLRDDERIRPERQVNICMSLCSNSYFHLYLYLDKYVYILIFVHVLILRWGFVHTNTIVFKKYCELYMESYRNREYKCIYMPVVTYCHLSWQCLWVYLRQTCWYTTKYSAWAGQWIYPNLYSGLHCDRRERKFKSRWAAFPLNMCGLYLK